MLTMNRTVNDYCYCDKYLYVGLWFKTAGGPDPVKICVRFDPHDSLEIYDVHQSISPLVRNIIVQ